MRALRPKLTYANVMATIAVFIALGGTSVAAISLKRNSVRGKHIAKDAITSPKVKDRSLLGKDFATGELPQGERGPQGEKGLTGDTGATGPSMGRSAAAPAADSCDPSGGTFVECAAVSFDLPTSGRVLTTATTGWHSAAGDNVYGTCQIRVDGTTQIGPLVHPGQVTGTHGPTDIGAFHTGSTALTAVSDVLAPGSHRFALECNQGGSNIVFRDGAISAVLLGPS